MAVPVCTALISGSHSASYPFTDLAPTKTISLTGSATNTPILEWEWSLLPTDSNNKGGYPATSTIASGTKGDFVDGKSSVQNPSAILDVPGGYCFTLRARNADGWSKPTVAGDGTSCQVIVYILTSAGVKLPPENMFRYAQDLNETLDQATTAISLTGTEGIIVTETTDSGTRTGSGVTPTEITQLRTTFYTAANEDVLATFNGLGYPGGTNTLVVYYQLDNEGWVGVMSSGDTAGYPQSLNWSAVINVSTAGSHTLKLAISNYDGGAWTLNGTRLTSRYAVTQFRGGYGQPENIPVLEYNSASQIHLHPSPGASSKLSATLNDGQRYTAVAPLIIDLTVSGLGGLDSGAEASSTWYYAYLVPDGTGKGLSALCSVNDPSTGPIGYTIWRYVGAFRNNGSSNIVTFYQTGNVTRYKSRVESAASASLGTTSYAKADLSLADTVPVTASAVQGELGLQADKNPTSSVFFDDFDNGTIDISYSNNNGTNAESGGYLTQSCANGISAECYGSTFLAPIAYKAFSFYDPSNNMLVMETRLASYTASGNDVLFVAVAYKDNGNWYRCGFDKHTNSVNISRTVGSSTSIILTGGLSGCDPNSSPHRYRIYYNSSSTTKTIGLSGRPLASGWIAFYASVDDGLSWEFLLTESAAFVPTSFGMFCQNGYGTTPGFTGYWDYLRIIQQSGSEYVVNEVYVNGETNLFKNSKCYTGLEFASSEIVLPIPDSSQKIQYRSETIGVLGIKEQHVYTLGWTDGYLSEKSSQAQAKYSPDTALPQLTYSSASAINVAAAPGQNSTVLLTLQDGKQRSFTGTLAWSFSNGVADLGLDEGSEASSTWYYAYAVPKSGADDFLTIRVSDNAPSSGPTGYTNWKYLGAFYNDGSSNIYRFYQVGADFHFASQLSIYGGNGTGYVEPETSFAEVSLASLTPTTAKRVFMRNYVSIQSNSPIAYWEILWSSDGVNVSAALNPYGDSSVDQNASLAFWIALDSNRSIWRKRVRNTGTKNLGWIDYEIYAYTDGWLSPSQSAGSGAPGKHAASHQNGGSDEIATATPAAAAIPKADSSGKLDSWVSLKEIQITVSASAGNYESATIVPTGSKIMEVLTEIKTAFNGSATLAVKIHGTSDLNVQLTTENDPATQDTYITEPLYEVTSSNTGVARVTVGGTPSVGEAKVIVRYTERFLA